MKKMILLAATSLAVVARAGAADNSAKINEALQKLDVKNDNHWTAAGEPRIDTVKMLAGDQAITRADIEAAAPTFNRESAGGENRPGTPATAGAGAPQGGAQGNTGTGAASAVQQQAQAGVTEPNLKADGSSGPARDPALDISAQTGMGGATTARSPEPVEGERRETHVELESRGEPGERPVGIVQGVTDQGFNAQGTPAGTVENAGRPIELSGEVAARAAGSVLTPSQAPAHGSNTPGISLGGAADPLVEARAPGGAVIMEGADPATFFEGPTAGGPFGHSGITAGDGSGQTQLGPLGDVDFPGDPDEVEALEAELEEASARSAQLRSEVDNLSSELHQSLRTEAQLRRRIEANRPRSATTTTIQTFLRASQERRAAAVREEREARKPRRPAAAPQDGGE
jgi:hypothetical protein